MPGDVSSCHCLPAWWLFERGGVVSGVAPYLQWYLGGGGRVPPSPASHCTATVISPSLRPHRTNGDLEIIFIAKQKQIYWLIISIIVSWFADRGGGWGDRAGSCERKSVYCVLINLPEKRDVARSVTNTATLSRIPGVLISRLREYWGLSECDFERFLPLFGFVFFFRSRWGTFAPHMACRTCRGDLWINKEIKRLEQHSQIKTRFKIMALKY